MARGTSRDRKKERKWRRLLRRQAGSGLSVRAWCHQHGEPESGFYWWRAELARRDEANGHGGAVRPRKVKGRRLSRSPAVMVPVRVVAPAAMAPVHIVAAEEVRPEDAAKPEGRVEIVLTDRRRVRLSGRVDRQMLADVMAVLEGRVESRSDQRVGGADGQGCDATRGCDGARGNRGRRTVGSAREGRRC